jgi:hypothetical protein
MLGPATSWQPGGQGLLLVLRLVTNLPSPSQPEVPKQYTYTATAIAAMACPNAGPSTRACAGLTRFICVNCSATGRLSSRGLFQGSIGPPCAATSAPPRPASPPTSAIKRSTLRLGQATSWRGRVGRPVQRRRFVTNLQVQHHIYILSLCLVSEQCCWHSG